MVGLQYVVESRSSKVEKQERLTATDDAPCHLYTTTLSPYGFKSQRCAKSPRFRTTGLGGVTEPSSITLKYLYLLHPTGPPSPTPYRDGRS